MRAVLIPCMSGLVYHGLGEVQKLAEWCLNPLYVGSRLPLYDYKKKVKKYKS